MVKSLRKKGIKSTNQQINYIQQGKTKQGKYHAIQLWLILKFILQVPFFFNDNSVEKEREREQQTESEKQTQREREGERERNRGRRRERDGERQSALSYFCDFFLFK